jgi:hypothetical protein
LDTYKRVLKDDFNFDQKIELHSEFRDYTLDGDVAHEAGFDALMTGVAFFKIMTYLNKDRKFPGIESI